MIPRRISEHVKAHDWFAVFIDFAIVVIGVFIGTNVTDWNDARKEHARSTAYTERLLGDLRAEYEYSLALRDYARDTLEASLAAFAGLTGSDQADEKRILVNAFRAGQYNWYERRRAVFDELVASSSLQLIRDGALRETAIVYYSQSGRLFDLLQTQGADSEYLRLFGRLVDPEVRIALRTDCGDRESAPRAGAVGLLDIGYDCSLSVDDAAVAKAVAALRGDPELLPALRRQAAWQDSEIVNIDIMLKSTGVNALFERDEQ